MEEDINNPGHSSASVAETPHGGASPGGGLFSIDPGLTVWTWVVFGLLFFILSRYAWRPMMEAVRKREQTLKDAVDNARRTKEELERISQRQHEMMSEAEDNAKKLMDETRANAEAASKAIMDKASQDAEKTIAAVKDEIERERQRTMSEIKAQAVEMVVSVSEKVLRRNLGDDAAQKEFIRKELEKQ